MNFTVSKNGYTEVPNGEYDLIFIVLDSDKTYKYYLHIIMNVPNNPGGTL